MAYKSKEDQKRTSDAFYQDHKDEIKAKSRLWKKCNPVKVFATRVKRNSKRAKVGFNLDLEWFQERLDRGTCEVSGLPFVDSEKPMDSFQPSVDRTDPNGGYTKDNCKMVVWMYNSCKGDNSHKDVMIFAKALCTQS